MTLHFNDLASCDLAVGIFKHHCLLVVKCILSECPSQRKIESFFLIQLLLTWQLLHLNITVSMASSRSLCGLEFKRSTLGTLQFWQRPMSDWRSERERERENLSTKRPKGAKDPFRMDQSEKWRDAPPRAWTPRCRRCSCQNQGCEFGSPVVDDPICENMVMLE